MTTSTPDAMEGRIIEAARQLFVEKGFVETSMGDIAARVGVNRPAINYYFRTKERLFEAVLGSIVLTFAPRVVGVVVQANMSLRERIEQLVDLYYGVFTAHPFLPYFIIRELNRDADLVLRTVTRLGIVGNAQRARASLEAEIQAGTLRRVPIRVMLLTFVSLLTTPFTLRPIGERVLLDEGEPYERLLDEWRPYIVQNMLHLLQPQPAAQSAQSL